MMTILNICLYAPLRKTIGPRTLCTQLRSQRLGIHSAAPREGLWRNEAGRVWVANDGPAVFLTLEVAWEHLIDDEGYTVLVADREPHARECTCP